ncbi:MAG: Cj0069 family protein [Myxococcota bacterium]
MKHTAVIFEVEGGLDKGRDGHRADSQPMLDALARRGFEGEIVFYHPDVESKLLARLCGKTTVVLSRVNPGDLKDTDRYWQFLHELEQDGSLVQTPPEVMSILSFKDLLYRLRHTPYAPDDTDFYGSLNALRERLPLSVSKGPRVLKKNFTSTGVGVWKVERLPNQQIRCIQASDNRERRFSDWTSFFRFISPVFQEQYSERPYYFAHRQGILDVPFLPEIRHGEIRIFFVRDQPFYVLHKRPKSGSFSAALFSGAEYTADARLRRWKSVVEYSLWGLHRLRDVLGGRPFPLIWSIDSIPDGHGNYFFSDINAAAVGFTTPSIVARISEMIAEAIERDLNGSPPIPLAQPTVF